MPAAERADYIKIIAAMLIYGTIGIFTRFIAMPSAIIAWVRSVVGLLFLVILFLVRRRMPDWAALRHAFLPLCVSGAALGLNWTLLFEAYRFTSVPRATVCYYFAPVFIMLAAPLLFHEPITKRSLVCLAAALVGMVFVSGLVEGGAGVSADDLRGVAVALLSAVLYAVIVCLNKYVTETPPIERTAFQLLVSSVVMLVILLCRGSLRGLTVSGQSIGLLTVVGVVHTGIAYVLYFSSVGRLPAQTGAMLSYLDPVFSILLSALILHEQLTGLGMVGAALVLGAAFCSQLQPREKKRKTLDKTP